MGVWGIPYRRASEVEGEIPAYAGMTGWVRGRRGWCGSDGGGSRGRRGGCENDVSLCVNDVSVWG